MILNGLERTEGGGRAEILRILNFDMAPVVWVSSHALCLRQGIVPFCKSSDAESNIHKTDLLYVQDAFGLSC